MSPRKPREDGIETRQALLQAARAEFVRNGYDLSSARGICRCAHVNSALLNRYFGSKENLYRLVAQSLFGDLGAPLSRLAETVNDDESWRRALYTWIDDMLFMTLPTQEPQKSCAALFRHEVTRPTKFHAEFKESFGRPVYEGLKKILSFKIKDAQTLDLWASSLWAQVSIYALVDEKWRRAFQPKGCDIRQWATQIAGHLTEQLFSTVKRS